MKIITNIRYKLWLFKKTFSTTKFIQDVLMVFGSLWLILEVLSFFQVDDVVAKLKSLWWLFVTVGTIITLYVSLPKLKYSYKIKNTDVSVNLIIADILNVEGSIFVPMNNVLDFDNSGLIMGSNSIIQQLINQNFGGDHSKCEAIVNNYLGSHPTISKNASNQYDFDTTIPISCNGKLYYIVCTSSLNSQGRSKTTPADLEISLQNFWVNMRNNGLKDDLVLPIVGTGRGRIGYPRRNVIKESVSSFINSNTDYGFCNSFTICIYPTDVKKYLFYFDELTNYIKNAAEQKFD